LITVKAEQLSEQHLAELALAIQNRWNVATFVKMHEIIVLDDEVEDESSGKIITVPIDPRDIERGMHVIMENLELDRAFDLERDGRSKFKLKLVDPTQIPKWVETATSNVRRPPEGVYECPHCVLPDTLILGDNKTILEYSKGNVAVGQTRLNEVIQTFVRQYKGVMYAIKANGMLPVITTPDHPILVSSSHTIRRRQGNHFRTEIQFSNGTWVAAKDVVAKNTNTDGNYVIFPIIKGSYGQYELSLSSFIKKHKPCHKGYRDRIPLNEDTGWLLGLFAAEGSIAKELRFSLNSNEEVIREKIVKIARALDYSTYTSYSSHQNSMLVTISSRVLARAFDAWCGHRAPNRQIPDFILFHVDEKILRAFLHGYEIGDSYDYVNKSRGNKVYRMNVTTSKILAQQLQLAYARLGIWAGISTRKILNEELILGRRCKSHVKYVVSYPLESNVRRRKVHFLGEKILSPVLHVTTLTYDGNVHNLETTDGTYLVSNAVVHNCGKWFRNELEMSLHTKLHYII
jgi:hypothetical protein